MAHMVSDKLYAPACCPRMQSSPPKPQAKKVASCHGQWPPDDEKPEHWASVFRQLENCRVLKGPGVFKGRGCSWGTLRIPFGKIGEP